MHSDLLEVFQNLEIKSPPIGHWRCENPASESVLAEIDLNSSLDAKQAVQHAFAAFQQMRSMPAPVRGEMTRRVGKKLRTHKEACAQLISLEIGKCIEESRGEVQEMIDICDYAVGLARMLGGRTLASERPQHRIVEQWHPLGPVLCISAFNFPMAVWSWNAAISWVCGNPVIWKPSLKSPLCAYAIHQLLQPVLAEFSLEHAMQLVIGTDEEVGQTLVAHPSIPLVSATGSCAMGRKVAPIVAARMGRCLLELGGNNAIIVDETADLELAARGILFGAVGTAGQRCTTTRRLFVEKPVLEPLMQRLGTAYQQIQSRIGDPRDPQTLVGPLIDRQACEQFESTIGVIKKSSAQIIAGGNIVDRKGYFVEPTLVSVSESAAEQGNSVYPPMQLETFAPILYVQSFDRGQLQQAIDWQNGVEQGLSSALFSDSLRSIERFLGPDGSDCGLANINIGTSGAEIGGAFGGEKATGGGRESGSDSWKAYMRRQTCTINGSNQLPLSQGIRWT